MTTLEGRAALVTGAAGGIGRAVALELARRGADVAVNYLRSRDAAEQLAADIRLLGRRAIALQADVRDYGHVTALVAKSVEALGTVDILVNNAGVLRDNLAAFMTDAEWNEVVDTSLKGAFHGIKAVARAMARRRWGRIVNLSSDAGLMGDVMRANYAAAKAGVVGLTKAMARELAASGVTVNAVAPGFVDTAMTSGLAEAKRALAIARVPLGRFGRPEEVASAIAFLASDDAAYITGEVLVVDGGLRM